MRFGFVTLERDVGSARVVPGSRQRGLRGAKPGPKLVDFDRLSFIPFSFNPFSRSPRRRVRRFRCELSGKSRALRLLRREFGPESRCSLFLGVHTRIRLVERGGEILDGFLRRVRGCERRRRGNLQRSKLFGELTQPTFLIRRVRSRGVERGGYLGDVRVCRSRCSSSRFFGRFFAPLRRGGKRSARARALRTSRSPMRSRSRGRVSGCVSRPVSRTRGRRRRAGHPRADQLLLHRFVRRL